MTDLLYYLAMIGVMVAAFVFLKSRRRATAARQVPELQADAAQRGWTFETDQTLIFEIFRWRGTTDGIPWVAEARRTGRDPHSPFQSFTRITRWSAVHPLAVPGPFALVRKSGSDEAPQMPSAADKEEMGGLVARLVGAATDQAFTVRFGEEVGRLVDAGSLTSAPGMEADFPDAAVLTSETQRTAIVALLRTKKEAFSFTPNGYPVSALVAPGGLSVSITNWSRTTEDLLPLVTGGVALVRALRPR